MKNDLIEKVSRKMQNKIAPYMKWDYQDEQTKLDYRKIAKAAIDTIRDEIAEPNAAMMFAGSNQLDDDGDYDAEHVWQSMLSASPLGEKEG